MQKDVLAILLAVLCILCVTAAVFVRWNSNENAPLQDGGKMHPDPATQTDTLQLLPYGDVQLSVGGTAAFEGVHITVLEITEDSRCPSDVQCIQAGTVRVVLQTVSGLGTSTDTLALGDILTTEAERITFTGVDPKSISTRTIEQDEYVFEFEVVKRSGAETEPAEDPTAGACYVGGCSAQLCSDDPDLASTCEYREAYACYQDAVCERQQGGECGWTQTAQLSACLQQSQ